MAVMLMYTIGVYVQHIILFVEKYFVIIEHLSELGSWICTNTGNGAKRKI